ncbi:MAG: flagellar basal body-associated FliL family protein [Desulfobacterales bacterium]|nr:flagellar basal body-associated FliL family protein [Desulfobacterales bacterium]
MEEKDEQFSGNELDEPEDESSKSIPKQEPIEEAEKKYKGKGRIWLFIAIALFLLSGVGYFYMNEEISLVTSNQKEGPDRFAIPKDQLLVFRSFVIPFKQSKKFTYISLTIAFKLPDKKLREQMIQEKNRLRGIIYDMLAEEINGLKHAPSLEKLKKCIIRAVNGALSTGRINEAYITDLLAV